MTSYEAIHWDIKNTADQVAEATAEHILACAEEAIRDRGRFRLVLAGGSTPKQAYEILAREHRDWSGWWFYYGDERCLPIDDPERNSVMARNAWLDSIGIDEARHFPIPGELGAQAGAQAYLETIKDIDAFDLVLLGMGEDGHTASLFPNQPWQTDARVIAVYDAPKPPPQRISLGPAAIHAARRRCFVVSGDSKTDAVRQWRNNADLPIQRAALAGDRVIIDRAAWGRD